MIDVEWTTGRIYIPKADMPLVNVSPEIRQLDVNTFRLDLKDLEASQDGIPYTDTHQHNAPVVVSGLSLARVVAIKAPYYVEFEDGQYTVLLIGANHNIADVKLANQVSIIVQNSAGLIDYASVRGIIT